MKIKKMVVISISIIVIGLLFQILPSNLTGMLTLRGEYFPATIEVSPEIAIHEEVIKIKITPPHYFYRNKDVNYWVSNKIYFYNNNLRKGERKVCTSSKCKGNYIIEYKIPRKSTSRSKWTEGTYKVKIYDYLNKKYIEDSFQLVNLSNPLIICKEYDNGDNIYHKGEISSYLTGSQVEKVDECNKYDYTMKELREYYCCEKTNPHYNESLGMCTRIETCGRKCSNGACFNHYN